MTINYRNSNPLSDFPATRWFFIFIAIHLVAWTLVPLLVRYNLPLDAIEGTIWGHQLEWGYDKNPFLNGWLTALAIYLGGPSGWMIYLFSQISVVICFWVVWQLAKNILPPIYALMAVMLLEGVQYYNLHAIDFNDNTLELGLWALTIYFFYKAVRAQGIWSWILTGIFAALGVMAKYYTFALLTSLLLFLLRNNETRKNFTTRPLYFGLSVFCLMIIPHIIWLFSHDFITVRYVFERISSPPSLFNHFFFSAQFAWQQIEVFLPAVLLCSFVLIGKKPLFARPRILLSGFDKKFLFCVGLGPFLLTILLAILLGIKLRAGWGMPLLSLWGILLIAWLQPHITPAKSYRFLLIMFIFLGALLTAYSLSLIHSKDTSSANFPGTEIAQTITQRWRDTFHTPLTYVAGSRWIGGNIGFYSKDHPAVFIEWDIKRSPWIDIEKMKQTGAVFVWEISSHESLPNEVQKKFPPLMPPQVLSFSWKRNPLLPPIKIGIALLPPEHV